MSETNIAVFVSSHGFGHAARSSAVMSALATVNTDIRYHVYTMSPEWFFRESFSGQLVYNAIPTDVGLIQDNPFNENILATLKTLNEFIPFNEDLVDQLASELARLNCELVLCDISPLGIQVAKKTGLPSVLVENFTWDWIYELYRLEHPEIETHIQYLGSIFAQADFHILTEPFCDQGSPDLIVAPISRPPKKDIKDIKRSLEISEKEKTVVITMGGVPDKYSFLHDLNRFSGVRFIVPGVGERVQRDGNVILLPHHSAYYHPDLIAMADAVVGKVGYSTLAEVYSVGIPYGYVARERFRESPFLTDFVDKRMTGIRMENDEYRNGKWIEKIDALLALPRRDRRPENGADQVAAFIIEHVL